MTTPTREKTESRKLPMMPIRDMVIFPYMVTPFVVGRESSVRSLKEALDPARKGKAKVEMTAAPEALMQRVTTLFESYVKLQQSLNYETMIASVKMDEPAKLSDVIAANLQLG